MWFGNKYYLDRIYIKIYNPKFALFKKTLISRHYDYLHNCKTLQILKHLNKNSFAFTSTYTNWTSMLPMTWNRIYIRISFPKLYTFSFFLSFCTNCCEIFGFALVKHSTSSRKYFLNFDGKGRHMVYCFLYRHHTDV